MICTRCPSTIRRDSPDGMCIPCRRRASRPVLHSWYVTSADHAASWLAGGDLLGRERMAAFVPRDDEVVRAVRSAEMAVEDYEWRQRPDMAERSRGALSVLKAVLIARGKAA